MPETFHALDPGLATTIEVRQRLSAIQAALAAEPDLVTGRDGEPSVGVAVLELLDEERVLRAELRRRAAAGSTAPAFRSLAQA